VIRYLTVQLGLLQIDRISDAKAQQPQRDRIARQQFTPMEVGVEALDNSENFDTALFTFQVYSRTRLSFGDLKNRIFIPFSVEH
jgi:hypothetical protein